LVYKKSIELPKANLHLIEESLVLLEFKNNVIIEAEDAKEIDQEIYYNLIDGKNFVVLTDARNIDSSITHEARFFFSEDKLVLAIRKAQALVVNDIHTKLLANFYMNFYKSKDPVKVFNDYHRAFVWLKSILADFK